MRAGLLLSLGLLAACGAPARTGPDVAAEYAAIYRDWDEARLLALFPADKPPWIAGTRKHLAWLHEQLGECGGPQLMWTTGPQGARWTHACERGALETWFDLDERGQIIELSVGATGVEPPPELLAAALAVTAAMPWAPDSPRPFKHNLDRGDAIGLGSCTLRRPWAFGPRQGYFHIDCERGDSRVLAVELDRAGLLTRTHLMSPDLYEGLPVEPEPRG